MSTTLKLSPQLRRRVSTLARYAGQSPHAFMVSAIQHQAEMAEKRREFVESALTARRDYQATGRYYDLDDVHAYLQARIAGRKTARRPRVRLAK